MTEEVKQVSINKIVSIGNVRISTQDGTISDLAKDMNENGQLVPIHVYQVGDKYVLKFGHRRLEAAKLLGWNTIQAILSDAPLDTATMILAQYSENEQRKGLSYMDKANVYAQLKEAGYSQRQIAQYFGVSDAAVSLALSTLSAPKKLQKAVDEGELSPSAIEPLLSLSQEDQEELADVVIRAKTVKKVNDIVNAQKQKNLLKDTKVENVQHSQDIDPLEEAAVEMLNDAVASLRTVSATGITHPYLVRSVRPTVEELVRQAASLKMLLDGEVWDDAKDLV